MQTVALRRVVRPMRLDDIAQVIEVERQSFSTAWPTTAFRREIQHNRLARYLVAVQRRSHGGQEGAVTLPAVGVGRILGGLRRMLDAEAASPEERGELIVGFIGIWLLLDQAHVVTVAVRDGYRRRGVGELLLIAAIETALREEQALVTLECRVSNSVAQRLYEKYGFQRAGLRPRYYSDNHEDAYVMSAGGIDTPVWRGRFERLRDEHRRRWGDYVLDL